MMIYRLDVELPNGFAPTPYKISDYYSLERAEAVNNAGTLTVELPIAYLNAPFAPDRPDLILCVMEKFGNYPWRLSRQTKWFVQSVEIRFDGTKFFLVVKAIDAIGLLLRRTVPYYAPNTQTGFTGSSQSNIASTFADDMIKGIIRTNLGTLATDYTQTTPASLVPLRSLSSSLFSVDANVGLAPTVGAKAISWRNGLLAPCQEIASDAAQLGTYLAYDVVWTGATLTFRTFINQRGRLRNLVRSARPVNLSPENGLATASLLFDYTNEYNSIYCAGQGEGNERIIQQAYDATRIGRSPFALREAFTDSRNGGTTAAAVLADAQTALRQGRPLQQFTATLSETPTFRYGVDGDAAFGDIVSANFVGYQFDVMLEQVATSVKAGQPAQHSVNLRSVL